MSIYSRSTPYVAKIKSRKLLTSQSSTKKVYHVELDIKDSHLTYQIGDSIAAMAPNNPEAVEQIIDKLNATGNEPILDPKTQETTTFRKYLTYKANIGKVSFHKLFNVEKTALPLIELVKHHQPHPEELCRILLPLMPRFYSIASSQKVHPDEIHLTIAHVSFIIEGQLHFGVGSHFLCELAEENTTPVPIYVQPSNHFTLPKDPTTPIILIGPGTGVAPFRAFLQERIANNAPGANWLFFGERNEATDFYYKDYFKALEQQNQLRLSLAFSRDTQEKIYVQHRLLEAKKEVWKWIENGAAIYVCGDANEMAKDVDAALQQIVHQEGGLIEEDARKFLKTMRAEKRYLLDVY